MTDDLRELYQEVILDHGKHPRNFGKLDGADHQAHGHNPMCGDTLFVFLALDENGRITGVSFDGKGCAISVASASMMTEIVKGKTEAEANRMFDYFHKLCTQDDPPDEAGLDPDDVDRLQVLSGVRQFPVRVKCATLAWHTLSAALDRRNAPVKTE
ncbi:Fe-S cluster assembly sulfur transfer protein SufU [uncultured Parasphingopyxis sp.]|uniref:Fe-S cluster assembly sulfur transfer protein SufU n=1 Tax=uncultured Parasphingopyxis sp. TaxID=1547918 RepID=UPI002636A249|nr:SUF system NifU family Fe-S cluster assembly protein [uncultured Parasphingopyxis sp.]